MKLRIACKHCGIERTWERGKDGVVRPEQNLGPYGVGHYPYLCSSDDATKGICEQRELATAMSIANAGARVRGRSRQGSQPARRK